ncbi:CAC, partial [Symbiodinium sp. CCMP2456]
ICTNSVISQQLGVQDIHLLGWGVAGKDALFLYLLAPIYFTLAVLVDVVAHSPLAAYSRHLDPTGGEVPTEEDEDVARERRRVSESDADVVRLLKLRKERDMPNVPHHPDHGSGEEDEGPHHVAVVSDTHVLKEVYEENVRYRDKISKLIRDYDLRFGGKAAEIQAALKVDPNTFTGKRLVLHRWISWWGFDTLIGVVILANSVVIGFESQVRAEMPLGCTGDCDCENQLDPTLTCNKIPLWIFLADYGFYAVYLTELVLRLGIYGVFVLKSHWVKFDTFLVAASTVDIVVNLVSKSEFLKQVMLVRLLRLARLARALRLMVQFQTLWQLVQGLFHSIGTIMWTFLLVTLLMYIYAVTGMELIRVEPDLALDHPYNVAAGGSFRDLMDAILTLLQVFSMDSIGSIYRPLIKQNTICFIYFFLALLILSIALMNLVTAVMVNSSLDQASEDKEAKKAWEAAKRAKQMEKLKEMFLELDEDGSGELSLDELLGAPEAVQHELGEIVGGGGDLT